MKGLVLLLCYIIIAICFFVDKLPQSELNFIFYIFCIHVTRWILIVTEMFISEQPNAVHLGHQLMNNVAAAVGEGVFSS